MNKAHIMSLRSLLGLKRKEGKAVMEPTVTETKPEEQDQEKPAEEPKKMTAEVKTLDVVAESTNVRSGSLRPEMRPHAFVIMPFGN